MTLRETVTAEESVHATTGERTVRLAGQESAPPLTEDQLLDRHAGLLGLHGALVQATFTDKSSLDGFYGVTDASAQLVDHQGEMQACTWTLSLRRIGSLGEADLESRLTGIRRANDFALSGESWHAPAIGHQAYYTGSSVASSMTRSTADGTITVYRSLAAGANPRWACPPASYLLGRARFISGSLEKTGTNQPLPTTGWELSNGLVRVTPGGSGTIVVAAWGGSAWETKNWSISDGTTITAWDGLSLLRNDVEHVIVRLVREQGPGEAGRIVLDLGLRRGSRFVEGYLQRSASATLSAFLTASETTTNNAASGYVVATSNDADGNRYTAGSARSFTNHANGGVSKAAVTALDFYLGVVFNGGSAVSGDAATDLRNQYIGALPEVTAGVRR
ncbi:hypothetical protein [Acrocarpospora phusangensis]|nr:hypothetical protein [Acrocarpospora phusangensis]